MDNATWQMKNITLFAERINYFYLSGKDKDEQKKKDKENFSLNPMIYSTILL